MAGSLQREIYAFIAEYIRTRGMPPTIREIGEALHIQSTGHIAHHLSRLEEKGLLELLPGKARGIKLARPLGIPVKGRIAAGLPIENLAESDQIVEVDQKLVQQHTYALEVAGNSMIDDHICHGDYVVVRPQSSCDNGDIVVAVHFLEENKSSATLKRFFQEQDQVRLQPANSAMNPIVIPRHEWDREWRVQGKVVAIFRQYHVS